MQRRINNGKGIFLLWLNWIIGSGALTLLIVLSLWVSPKLLPFVAFAMQLALFVLIRRNRESDLPVCYLLPFVVSRILFWSGTIMLIIDLLYNYGIIHRIFPAEEINTQIPFITVLIVAPISMAISGWGKIFKHDLSFCKDCNMRFGSPAERGFLGMLYTQEGQYQLTLLFFMCTGCTLTGWIYYAVMYVNSDLNTPDRFVYIGIPSLLWLASAIYVGIRCIGLWSYYYQNVDVTTRRQGYSTMLRYIMIHDNRICLREPDIDPNTMVSSDCKFDIPVSTNLNHRESMPIEEARRLFRSLTKIDGGDIRFMYATGTGNADCDIFHYLCYLTDEQKQQFDSTNPKCDWYHFQQIAEMLNSHQLNTLFSAEIVRLHTIAMAWKTYTIDGKRRYKIKHYRPTFRICDIKDWDVDFNDTRWLYVANNNEDVPFYRMRLLWRKYVNGVGEFKNTNVQE